jgi:two-component system NarL family sensor kinase
MSDSSLNDNTTQEKFPIPQETTALLQGNPDLAVLYAIAGYLNHRVNVHDALQEILARVTELLHLRTGWVWLLNEQGVPYLAASQALPPYLAHHSERMSGSCLCLDTFLSGTSEGAANINVLRCSRLKNAERNSDPSSLGLRFHASIPIYADNTLLGVLNVASEDWRELHPQELQLLHIISDQIGLAMQRAQLSAEHTRAATRLATIEERNRLARDIHDTLAQGLAAITLQLEAADALAEARPQRAHEAIQRALALARANLAEARNSVMDLRAAPLQEHTLPEALALLAKTNTTAEMVVSYSSIPATNFPTLPARLEAGLYRVAQEALTNVQKHAFASHVEIVLRFCADGECEECDAQAGDGRESGPRLQLLIRDDGRGFDPETVFHNESHFGLLGMSERVKLLGGNICIQSVPAAGTCIEVSLPLQARTKK